MTRHDFAFAPAYRLPALMFGVTPGTAWLELDDPWQPEPALRVRFGLWRLRTPISNIAGVEESGPYDFVKTAGPPHLSFVDRGVTFATNGVRGLCVSFHQPIAGLDPTGRLLHPAATLTVQNPALLAAQINGSAAWDWGTSSA